MRLNEYLEIKVQDGQKLTGCIKCGHIFGPASENPKKLAKMKKFPMKRSGPWCNPWENRDDMEHREFYCPGCGRMFAVEVIHPDEPFYWETNKIE
ncbi:MAG: acetone carboxylase subunit gamma [Pseudomonadota bacterium]